MNSFDPATGYPSAGSTGTKASLKVGLAMCVMLVLLILQGTVGLLSLARLETMQEEAEEFDAPVATLARVRGNMARVAYFTSRLSNDPMRARERCMTVLDESIVTLDALDELSGRGTYRSLEADLKSLMELVGHAAERAEEKDEQRQQLGRIHQQLRELAADTVATQNDIVKETVSAQSAKPQETERALSRLSLAISLLDTVHNLRAQALAFASLDSPEIAQEAKKTISRLRETLKALSGITPEDTPLAQRIDSVQNATRASEQVLSEAGKAQEAVKSLGNEISMRLDKMDAELEEHLVRQREMKGAIREEALRSIRVSQTLQFAVCIISVILGIVLALLAAKSVGTETMPGPESAWNSATGTGDPNGRLAALERRMKELEEGRG